MRVEERCPSDCVYNSRFLRIRDITLKPLWLLYNPTLFIQQSDLPVGLTN